MTRTIILLGLLAGCSDEGASGGSTDLGALTAELVVNEVFPHGQSGANPDFAELKNTSSEPVDVSGFLIRDKKTADNYPLPSGTVIPANGYLVIYCDDQTDGGVSGGVHVPWKLSASKGDEIHLSTAAGVEIDQASFGEDLPEDKSWGRLPDGTGAFVPTKPTPGAANL